MFKKDTGMCKGMPYLDVRDNHEALVLLQTFREKFGLFTERQVNCAIASHDMQARVAQPTDEKFKHMLSGKSLDNCSIVANYFTNTEISGGLMVYPSFSSWGMEIRFAIPCSLSQKFHRP